MGFRGGFFGVADAAEAAVAVDDAHADVGDCVRVPRRVVICLQLAQIGADRERCRGAESAPPTVPRQPCLPRVPGQQCPPTMLRRACAGVVADAAEAAVPVDALDFFQHRALAAPPPSGEWYPFTVISESRLTVNGFLANA